MKIEEARKRSCSCIYKLTFPNGKSYVGQTKNLGKRIKLYVMTLENDSKHNKVMDSIKEFGLDSIDVSILSEPKNLSETDKVLVLSILEIAYIRSENTLFPNGYNVSIGGELLGIPSDYIKTNISKNAFAGSFKPILLYDLDGKFVKEYESIEKGAYDLGISSPELGSFVDKRNSVLHGEYMIRTKRYGEIPEHILPFKPKVVDRVVKNTIYEDNVIVRDRVEIKPRNTVLKYNASGEFCGEYDTAMDAALSIGKKAITKGILTSGYIFFDHDSGEIKQNIGIIERKSRRLPKYSDYVCDDSQPIDADNYHKWSSLINDFNIGQYDREGNYIKSFNSINEASYMTGIRYSCIWSCVFGKTHTAGGYIWRKMADKE